MIDKDHIQDFESTLSRFRWENYSRAYKQFSELQRLYWHIITLDYLDTTYHHLNDNNYDTFARRVYMSFMGIFYRPHEIIVKLEQSFEAFLKLYITDNEKEWSSIKNEYRNQFVNHFTLLHEYIRRFLEHKIDTQPMSADLHFNLTDFDGIHKNIEQVVSSFLGDHLKGTRYGHHSSLTELTNFPFLIPDELVQNLHSSCDIYFKSRFLYWFTRNFEANLPNDGHFKRPRYENMQQAFDGLIQRYPRFTALKKGTLTELLHLYSLDTSGERFQKSTIRAFLRRKEQP